MFDTSFLRLTVRTVTSQGRCVAAKARSITMNQPNPVTSVCAQVPDVRGSGAKPPCLGSTTAPCRCRCMKDLQRSGVTPLRAVMVSRSRLLLEPLVELVCASLDPRETLWGQTPVVFQPPPQWQPPDERGDPAASSDRYWLPPDT